LKDLVGQVRMIHHSESEAIEESGYISEGHHSCNAQAFRFLQQGDRHLATESLAPVLLGHGDGTHLGHVGPNQSQSSTASELTVHLGHHKVPQAFDGVGRGTGQHFSGSSQLID